MYNFLYKKRSSLPQSLLVSIFFTAFMTKANGEELSSSSSHAFPEINHELQKSSFVFSEEPFLFSDSLNTDLTETKEENLEVLKETSLENPSLFLDSLSTDPAEANEENLEVLKESLSSNNSLPSDSSHAFASPELEESFSVSSETPSSTLSPQNSPQEKTESLEKNEPQAQASKQSDKTPPLIELKGGYFIFADSKMRKVYNDGGWDVQLSGSYPIWKWLHIYGSVEYLERHGKSLHEKEHTSIWELPLSLGLKPIISICPQVQYYFAIGPQYFFLRSHNHSPYVKRHVHHSGFGGFVNTGFNFLPWDHFLIDVFAEYAYRQVHIHNTSNHVYGRDIQVGGFTFGLGLGYAF